jgi:hypothetical protein
VASVLVSVAGLALVAAGCAGQEQSGTPAARVTTWVSGGGGGAAIGTLRGDAARVDQALAQHVSGSQLRTICAVLTNDAETAIGNLPTPDTTLTGDLNAGYSDAAAAGDDCYTGASGNRGLLDRSATERARLGPLLSTAVDRIVAVTGHTPSTSTTAPSGAGLDPFGG